MDEKEAIKNITKLKKVTQELAWKNIDHETYRTYVFPNIFFKNNLVTINNPILLHVSKSGGHRILDKNNVSHYIPKGWIHLFWETNDKNAFRF